MAISAMAGGIHSVAASMSEIANSSNEQSMGLKEISGAVQQLDQITQDNAQMVGLAVQQAEALEQRASTLNRAVAAFQLQQGTAEEAVGLVRKAVELHRSTSREQFLGRITDKAGGFHDRDMYVFVLDETGRYLAFGGNPSKVGTVCRTFRGSQAINWCATSWRRRSMGLAGWNMTSPTLLPAWCKPRCLL